jgi:hypothetical protein
LWLQPRSQFDISELAAPRKVISYVTKENDQAGLTRSAVHPPSALSKTAQLESAHAHSNGNRMKPSDGACCDIEESPRWAVSVFFVMSTESGSGAAAALKTSPRLALGPLEFAGRCGR